MVSYILVILAIWEIIWKGIAMWKAARNSHKNWFIALLLLNTAGILPIAYIYYFEKKKPIKKKKKHEKTT